MSCQICHYITGHGPGCRHFHEEVADDNASLRARIGDLERDHAHLSRLYAESRDYVGALERERDALVEAVNRGVAEYDRLDAEAERMRPVYAAAKRMCTSVPLTTAKEMCAGGFHTATCDLVEAVDRAIAAEPEQSPYRGTP